MLAVIIVAIVAYVLSQLTFKTDTIDDLIKETHRYSGIDADSWTRFYTNIQLAREYRNPVFLHKAIDHLNEMALYMVPIDPDVQGDIARLGHEIEIQLKETWV
jgi:predicted RND superfamily exporter protein